MRPDLTDDRAWARDWLFDAALPLWWARAADHDHGGWFDKLDRKGDPIALPKRLRVQARQAFVYAEAGRLGWDGPWEDATAHGIDFMLVAFRRRDGLFRASVTHDGVPVADAADLYDQAFVLLALASGYAMLGRPPALLAEAETLLDRLVVLLSHPERGFEEANPRRLPLRSNPHMHMLEALLAWVEAGGGRAFEERAQQIVTLALDKLIDPRTGAVGEYYDGAWNFMAGDGRLREPGHQYEWAYLLDLAGRLLGGDHARFSERLHRFGTCHGLINGRVIFSVDADGAAVDRSSRLWAQTERLRTMLVLAPSMTAEDGDDALSAAAESVATLKRFLDVPSRGLWFDRMDEGGTCLDEPSPASSLYHIVTGLVPLIEAADKASPPSVMPLARSAP